MKTMKQNQTASLTRAGFTRIRVSHRINLCLLAVHGIAAGSILALCLTSAPAADALPAKTPDLQASPAQKPAYTPQGRQMGRYKAFARQAQMPAIKVLDQTTLAVGDTPSADLHRLARLSAQQKEALADPFGVPASVLGKVLDSATNSPPPDAAQLAQDLRTAVIDYRFLHGEWERYHPPAEGQQTKADALQAMQSGDIAKAWELYDGLQRPAPPANLRVAAQP